MFDPEQNTPFFPAVNANCERLGYRLAGDPHGQVLAVTHGWAADSEFTIPLAELFPSFKVMLIDLPGYGLSASLADSSKDFDSVAKLISNTVPAHSVLMSWSLSTLYAIRACSFGSFTPSALITICGSPRFPDEKDNPGFNQHYIRKLNLSFNAKNAERLIKLFYAIQGIGAVGEAIKASFARFTIPSYEVLQSGILHMTQGDERENLMNLSIPKLHLFGKQDLLVPSKQASLLANSKNTTVHIFEQSAHLPFITEKKAFTQSVINFLNNIK